MFAFVLYDSVKSSVLFCRDRLGVKPLYVYERDGLILFASEIKAFHQHPDFQKAIDKNALGLYLRYGHVPGTSCIFQHTKKIKSGTTVTFNLKRKEHIEHNYWNATEKLLQAPIYEGSEESLYDTLEYKLQEACTYRMVSDVPVGVFLSGGYDSSLVAAILQRDRSEKIDTFTIGFDDPKYDESPHAARVARALGTRHHVFRCTQQEAREIIPSLIEYYDEPFADSSAIPTFLLSKLSSKYVKVALSADGGDELFAGYKRNLRFIDIHKRLDRLPAEVYKMITPFTSLISNWQRASKPDRSAWMDKLGQMLKQPDLLKIFNAYPEVFSSASIRSVIGQAPKSDPKRQMMAELYLNDDQLNAMLAADYQSTLTDDMLVKVDRATMAHGLEGREPLLDHRLFEFLAGVPSRLKLKDRVLKHPLKEITHRYLPVTIMDRPKMGFGLPIQSWLCKELSPLLEEHLSERSLKRVGVLNHKPMRKMLKRLRSQPEIKGNNQLWNLLVLQMWASRWYA